MQVLGETESIYEVYKNNIRREYRHIPGFIYNRERKKILKRFVASEQIFKTDLFRVKFEEKARVNLLNEIKSLYFPATLSILQF